MLNRAEKVEKVNEQHAYGDMSQWMIQERMLSKRGPKCQKDVDWRSHSRGIQRWVDIRGRRCACATKENNNKTLQNGSKQSMELQLCIRKMELQLRPSNMSNAKNTHQQHLPVAVLIVRHRATWLELTSSTITPLHLVTWRGVPTRFVVKLRRAVAIDVVEAVIGKVVGKAAVVEAAIVKGVAVKVTGTGVAIAKVGIAPAIIMRAPVVLVCAVLASASVRLINVKRPSHISVVGKSVWSSDLGSRFSTWSVVVVRAMSVRLCDA